MGSSSTLKRNIEAEISLIDSLPVYVKKLIAGGVAGAFAKTTIALLERIKILLQVTSPKESIGYGSCSLQGRWNACAVSRCSLKFYIYEELKRRVPEEHQNSVMLRLSCGDLAGLSGK
ncbi:hypothetical protein MKX01_025620 [Papaver californicum]|nr:hypothetical protein MKX01_025620 [Papaver californicum]